ncbi:cation transport ATPase (P-type) domain-containing protein [Ditylenchus destructor]|uniref:Phospholipid-transporting ATPase n=1 Tax=Ditylenchus destructor TaxID=166010 RepID=A0AAD4R1U3_9BILA|nr:cation transport ATPase (P-type) domain-containing protein [Ditylenchus destructor]
MLDFIPHLPRFHFASSSNLLVNMQHQDYWPASTSSPSNNDANVSPTFMSWLLGNYSRTNTTTQGQHNRYSALPSSSSSMSSSNSTANSSATTPPPPARRVPSRTLPRRLLVNRIQDELHRKQSQILNLNQDPHHPQFQIRFCSNEISTCKYNAFSFLPRFLLEQFRRYSNVFFLVIALLQQIPDKRRRMDSTVNNYKVEILRNGEWQTNKWRDLKVGEIVKVYDGHSFPADLVLISSSEHEGMAYIETSNLDGETNLKIRQALHTSSELTSLEQLNGMEAEIECEPPSRLVNEFTGTLKLGGEQLPLTITQLLLRGSKLKNTKWVHGVAVYTGHDARLLMNSRTAPLKRSNIDTLTNRRIVVLFFTLVLLAVTSATGAEIYNKYYLIGTDYLPRTKGSVNFAWNVLTFFILYNNLIPISLQVTLEVVRFFQAFYINQDQYMYDEATDTPANARTSNLNEELGQIKFLMTDKTGTLTCNVMKFKRCTVGGPDAELIRDFLLMMASCHTVVPEKDQDSGELNYQSSSPDEGALVRGASQLGFVFHTRRPKEIFVKTDNGEIKLQLLNVLEFSSDRKRMSVVVKDEKGRIRLFCKGADNIIIDRLSPDQDQNDLNALKDHLDEYATKGYRTLCFATATIDEQFYQDWANEFRSASLALDSREKKLADAAEKIERNLKLAGATAIEDKLQDNVPLTIRSLLAADIRIWMLTGDKRETAINIAQSSALCTKKTKLMIIDKRSYDEVLEELQKFNDTAHQYIQQNKEFALVINGAALHHAIVGEARRLFTELAMICHSVICCRMTPMQKAEIVEVVKEITGLVVASVGDGANDVAMIQAANVGIGITGEEGLQAASASDYSIGQFQFLRRLLLVHGTWNYDRSVKVILYSFYKNICLYIIELWFAFFSAFSGTTIFERWTIGTFNVLFTALPPIVLGLFDRPISDTMMLKHPSFYQTFQKLAFSNVKFSLWIAMSLWHSLVLFFLSYGYMKQEVVWDNGRSGGWLMFGNACYTFVVATVSLKALLECDTWTWTIYVSVFGSILLWFVFLFIYSWVWPHLGSIGADMSGMAWIMTQSPSFWAACLFIPLSTLLLDFVVKGVCTNLYPTPRERLALMEQGKRVPLKRGRSPNAVEEGLNMTNL